MVRSIRDARLETRSTRLKLPIAKKPIFQKIGVGIGLGYRRNRSAGTWVVRLSDGKGSNIIKSMGIADDYQDADGTTVFDFWQAQDRARAIFRTRSTAPDSAKPISVTDTLNRYESDLKARKGDPGNVARVRSHLPETLGNKSIFLLTSRDLRGWRDQLAKALAPATVNRTTTCLKAALNAAADHDDGIISRKPWEVGLASLPNAEESRNVVISEDQIRQLIDQAYVVSVELGYLVEAAAVTGTRVSQLARLQVRDIQGNRADPRLMMPSSRKGRGRKISHAPIPITAALLEKLMRAAGGRRNDATLLLKPSGKPWSKSDHSRLFARAAQAAGLNTDDVTIYALRHSNIVRQLLAGIPIRVVATNHDTSITMIERNYSRHIGDHSDQLARRALLDTGATGPASAKVVPISAGR